MINTRYAWLFKLELYLLTTGKFSLFFSWYFRFKYRHYVEPMHTHFKNWQVIQEGITETELYRLFLRVYGWPWVEFKRTLQILLYTRLIERVDNGQPYCLSRYRLAGAPRLTEQDVKALLLDGQLTTGKF